MDPDAVWTLAKIAGPLLRPSLLFTLLLLAGGTLLLGLPAGRIRLRRIGRLCLGGALVVAALVLAIDPGALLLARLERAYPPPPKVDAVADRLDPAGIIVLGGAVDLALSDAVGHLQVNRAAERPLVFAELARAFPQVPAVYSGGAGRPEDRGRVGEAARIGPLLARLGLPPERVFLETASRSTAENARRAAALLAERGIAPRTDASPWILVTSARHMPRALGVFAAAGFSPLLAWPTDYSLPPSGPVWRPTLNLPAAFGRADAAAYELAGLLWYGITGRIADPQSVPIP